MNDLINEILFIVTYRCNLRCEYCFSRQDWFGRKDEMDVNGYKTILSEIRKKAFPPKISISGGEPFLREDIEEIINVFLEHTDSQILINTNALLMKDKHFKYIESLKNEFKERLSFAISLDGPKEIMKNLHKNENIFDKVIQTSEILKGEGIRVGLNIVCLRINKDVVGKFVRSVIDKYDYISLFRFLPMGLGTLNKDRFWINEKEVNSIIDKVKEIDRNKIKYGKLELRDFCAAKDRVIIDPQGFVKVCIASFWEERLRVPFYDLKTGKLVKRWSEAVTEAQRRFKEISKECPDKPKSCRAFNCLLQSQKGVRL